MRMKWNDKIIQDHLSSFVVDLTVSKRPGTSYRIETILQFLIAYIFYFPSLNLLKLGNHVYEGKL